MYMLGRIIPKSGPCQTKALEDVKELGQLHMALDRHDGLNCGNEREHRVGSPRNLGVSGCIYQEVTTVRCRGPEAG